MKSVSSSEKHSNAHGFSMSGNSHFPFPEKNITCTTRRDGHNFYYFAMLVFVRGYFFPRTFENYLWGERSCVALSSVKAPSWLTHCGPNRGCTPDLLWHRQVLFCCLFCLMSSTLTLPKESQWDFALLPQSRSTNVSHSNVVYNQFTDPFSDSDLTGN